ncbi:unnamed protein product [Allacma fusca]|uniref:TNF receptor-associated factor 6 n=1 Tax=Allacma fusca TaxID=39272 RepID=A0A8J2NZ44_9HEXA|nr:unnamed protein product [Allacma fusca]
MSIACSNDEVTTLSTFLSTSSTIPHGGFDYELLGGNTDSRYECPICLLYMRNPVITSCGHRFCGACISQWTGNQSNLNGCPVDGTKLSEEHIFPDNCTRREILACKAKCPYLKEGCSAILTLSEMDKHVELHHTLSLNSSNGSMRLNGIVATNGNTECMFKEFGCVSVFQPDQLQRHLETEVHHHLQLCTASYKRLKKILSRPPVMEYPNPRDLYTRQGSNDSGRWLLFDDIDSDEYNFRRQRSWDSVRFARRYHSRTNCPERLAESDESLSKHSSQLSGKEATCSNSCHSTLSAASNHEGIQLKDLFERIVRLEQNDREKQIKIDRLESQLSSVISLFSKVTCFMDDLTARYCNGTFVWKITGFQDVCKEMRNTTRVLTSPGFYTDTFGYKLCLRFNLTTPKPADATATTAIDVPLEMDDSTHVGLYVHFMQGEFDEAIPWPFIGEIKITIVHPKNPEQSLNESVRSKPEAAAFAKPIIPRNPTGIGYPDVCSLKKIFSDGFVQNDSLHFKILAKTT